MFGYVHTKTRAASMNNSHKWQTNRWTGPLLHVCTVKWSHTAKKVCAYVCVRALKRMHGNVSV